MDKYQTDAVNKKARRVRSAAYRARRQKRHFGRHYFIDEPLPGGGEPEPYLAGWRVTEYRHGHIVSVDINPPVRP
jgi:hypothetical protein